MAGPTPAYAAETTTRILRAPLDLSVVLPCAHGGLGEVVHFDGTFSEVYHVTVDETGGFHVHIVETQSTVHGIGATTGDRYVSGTVTVAFDTYGAECEPTAP
ncbi:hypothetical protein [Micromonospora chersina]|uniref:hypothetical protein n=1 Tax=Micromonospora chersina TaxID=47854 RepID=UPI0037178843